MVYSVRNVPQRKSVSLGRSTTVNHHLRRHSERSSIDEAFIDFTRPVRSLLLERYADLLGTVPAEGLDSPLPPPPSNFRWETGTTIVPLRKDLVIETTTWHDIALNLGAELLAATRSSIMNDLGYGTSAGLARNKFLAKVCRLFLYL